MLLISCILPSSHRNELILLSRNITHLLKRRKQRRKFNMIKFPRTREIKSSKKSYKNDINIFAYLTKNYPI